MTILSDTQIAQLAYKAGFRGQALNVAVAIALAESGGNTNAYNPELAAGTPKNSGSRGLWQIYGVAHPEYNNAAAFNPLVNAQAAFKVFKEAGNRFTPWSTYNAGMANPKKDYSKLNLAGVLNMPTTTKNITQPQKKLLNSLSNQMTIGSGTQTQKEQPAPQVIAETIKNTITGGRSASDITFYFIGGFFILVAIVFLLIGTETGREIGKTAIAAAI